MFQTVYLTLEEFKHFKFYTLDFIQIHLSVFIVIGCTKMCKLKILTMYKVFTYYIQVIGVVHHMICGKLDGKVFTNGWPEFSSVICQHYGILTQRVSHPFISIICYYTLCHL